MKLEEIKRYWESSGESNDFGSMVTPTSRDPYLGELERENILRHLVNGDTCLEIGCGDAFHTVHYAKKVNQLFGIDVADSLINVAERRVQQERLDNINLLVGSVLDIELKFKGKKFDYAISQRCLINLPTWELQKDAIFQVHQLLKDQGIFLLTEGFQDNLDELNSVREEFNLPAIKVVDYNQNFVLKDFEKYIHRYFEVIAKRYYGSYLFFSRVYHPLVVLPENPKHDSKLNEVAMKLQKTLSLPDLDKYSYNIFYVLRKREL